MMNEHYTLEFWVDDNWHVGRLKEIPGVFSQGKTLEELQENIWEVYVMLDDRGTPPPPDFVFEELLELPQPPVP